MAKKKATKKKASKCGLDMCKDKCSSDCGCTYILAALGMAIYNISMATGFWNGVWGVIKALVWPATLMIQFLKFLA